MVNKTQFYKTKVALAVVLSLGLAACGDSDGDAGAAATQNTVGNQNQLSGTVQGVVVDSNANPIAGVAVYLGNAETVTNAGGQYVFTNVGVTDVQGVNNEGDESDNDNTQTLVVTIAGTADFLGALVTVTPRAQVNNTGGQGDTDNGDNSLTTIQTFVDGFTAEAGIAVLPRLNAGAYGFIRDCRTGLQLTDTASILSLDFDENGDDLDANVSGGFENGTLLTNSEDTHTVGSDANGAFSLTALAANSTYTITPKQGWVITTNGPESAIIGSLSVSTGSEGSSELLNTIEVCPVGFVENDVTPGAPFINTVSASIGTTTGGGTTNYEYTVLTKGVDGTGGITLNFSEAITAGIDVNDVVVTLAANDDDTVQTIADIATKADGTPDVTLAADGLSLTVVLANPLADEQRFSIWFPKWQYLDNKGNKIVTGDDEDALGAIENVDLVQDDDLLDTLIGDGDGSDEFGIISDMISQETGKVGYVRTRLCTYIAPPKTPEGLVGEQLVKTLDASLLAVGPLWDNNGDGDLTDGNVSNLNGQEDAADNRDTGERLETRFGGSVTNDLAVIVGSVQNATGITAAVVAGTGAATFSYGTPVINADGTYSITADDTAHGTQVTLTPQGAFGVSGTPVTVTLEDKVTPTTILQENYELWAVEAAYNATTVTAGTGAAGSGGEVAEGEVAGADGDPIIYIQPRHLSPTTNNLSDRYEEFDSFQFNTAGYTDAFRLIDAIENPLYSGPGYAGWTTRGNSLGVAFSETIATTVTAPLHSASINLTLTGVLNGLTTDIDGNTIIGQPDTVGAVTIPNNGNDLARFTVSDMVDFANNDHNEAIDFTNGSIADTQSNAANANSQARVVIRDAMPAFVTAARWDGSNIIINFNERIVPENGDVLRLGDLTNVTATFPLTLVTANTFPTEGAYSLNVAGNELTVAVDAANMSGLFQNGPGDVFLFDSNGDATTENHLALNWDDIEDSRGNSWATFDRDENATPTVDTDGIAGADRFGRYLVDAPRFMLYNDVGIFTITKQTIGYLDGDLPIDGDDDGIVTVRFSFSHPIDLLDDNDPIAVGDQRSALRVALDDAQPGDYNGALTLTTAQLQNIFALSLTGIPANAPFANGASLAASFSADYKVISLTLHEAANDIDAGITRIDFWETVTFGATLQVDSAITDEFLAAENYTVVNSN